MNATARCDTCKWFQKTEPPMELNGKPFLIGECRRRSPVVGFNEHAVPRTHWPAVYGYEGCGEHEL